MAASGGTLAHLLTAVAGVDRTANLLRVLVVPAGVAAQTGPSASRAVIAQALNALLFEDLLNRVPMAAAYVEDCLRNGTTVLHDHGAVRTVDLAGMRALPQGREAIVRLLRPLGYTQVGEYPLDRLKMTGRSYAQAEFPEEIAQFFISELHVDRFTPEFAAAVHRVTAQSTDPLTAQTRDLLFQLDTDHSLPLESAAQLLPVLLQCFGRQHPEPSVTDYEALLKESAEMAWIATEGNVFNHATDRVADVDALAAQQKALGRPMKDVVETSHTGRVKQTAFLAARVRRSFRTSDGSAVEREVPGSFIEFITRLPLPDDAGLDLSFDSANAQGIFKMTSDTPAATPGK